MSDEKAKPKKRKASKAIDYTSPKYLAMWDTETLAAAVEQTEAIDAARIKFNDAKEKAAGLKKVLDGLVSEHFAWHRDRERERGKPPCDLFADMKASDEAKTMQKFAAPPPVKGDQSKVPEDLWQKYPLARFAPGADGWAGFGLTAKDVEILATGEMKKTGERFPLVVFGDVTRFTAPIPGTSGFSRKLTDIKGVGLGESGLNERFQDAQTKFFEWWAAGGAEAFAAETKPAKEKKPGATPRGGSKKGGSGGKGRKGQSGPADLVPTVEADGPDDTAAESEGHTHPGRGPEGAEVPEGHHTAA